MESITKSWRNALVEAVSWSARGEALVTLRDETSRRVRVTCRQVVSVMFVARDAREVRAEQVLLEDRRSSGIESGLFYLADTDERVIVVQCNAVELEEV